MKQTPGVDNFQMMNVSKFGGYYSSVDPTNAPANVMIRGSQNVYKDSAGNIGNRFGRKQYDAVDATIAGTKAAYVWNTSLGFAYAVRVANSKFEILSDITGTKVWYTLMSSLAVTRGVFDTWWDNTNKKDKLLFVLGDNIIYDWSGGVALLEAGSNDAIGITGNNAAMTSFSIADSALVTYTSANSLAGTSLQAAIALTGNPANGDTLTLTINGTIIGVQFVSVIGAVAGNVLIGVDAAATIANLLGLLQNPGTTNATQVAFSGPNQTLIGYSTYASTKALIKTGSSNWGVSGFAPTGSVIINGNTYTYTGGYFSTILTGVNTNPSAEAQNSAVVQAVLQNTNTPTTNIAGFTNDFIRVIGNRLHVGSYNSRNVYVSSNTNYANFSVPGTRVSGDPELLTLDNNGTGIGVRQGNAHVSAGTSDWYIVSYVNITVGSSLTEQTNVEKQQTSNGAAALAHEFIEMLYDQIVYVSQDQQLRIFGNFRNLTQPAYPMISEQVSDDLENEDFTGGQLKIISGGSRGDMIYIVAPNSGTVYIHQTTNVIDSLGNVITQRLWHSPFVWGVSRIDVIGGQEIGFSNSNPQVYTLWDTAQWRDDSPSGGLPYTSIMLMSYKSYGRRQGMIRFDKIFWEGYMTPGTSLMGAVYYDYQGATRILSPIIHSIKQGSPANSESFFSGVIPPSLGDSSLGDNPLGDVTAIFQGNSPLRDQDLLPKFRIITGVEIVDHFESALMVYTAGTDDRWSLVTLGVNVSQSPNSAIHIIKRTV